MTSADHVLVPFEGSSLSVKALETALAHHQNAEITVLHVCNPVTSEVGLVELFRLADGAPPGSISESIWTDWYERVRERSADVLEVAAELAEDRDREIRTETAFGDPDREIVEFAERDDIDLIVMGSHTRTGMARIWLGSVADRVVRTAPVPVMIVR